jgi:hypothetical protein
VADRETASNPELPASIQHYDRRMAPRASAIDKVIFLASVVPFALIVFGWRLHGVTVALQLALPWILAGIVACCPKLFSLEVIRLKGFSQGAPHFVGAPYIWDYLFLSWFLYVEQVGWTRMVWLAVAVGFVLFSVSIAADATMRRGRNWPAMVALFGSAVFHGYVTVLPLNVLLDRSPATVQKSLLAQKSGPHTRIRQLHLTIEPWGPITEAKKVSAPYRVYQSVQPGDAVCLVLRQGALSIPWYTAQICPWDGGTVRLGAIPSE